MIQIPPSGKQEWYTRYCVAVVWHTQRGVWRLVSGNIRLHAGEGKWRDLPLQNMHGQNIIIHSGTILDHARDNTTLLIKKALHIGLAGRHSLINTDQGIAIGDIWKTFLKYTKRHWWNPLSPGFHCDLDSTITRKHLALSSQIVALLCELWWRLQYCSWNVSYHFDFVLVGIKLTIVFASEYITKKQWNKD